MAVNVALPVEFTNIDCSILTLIIPAIGGCNLNCPFCFIDLRKEDASNEYLRPEDYILFIDQMRKTRDLGAICIQGYEPLLPDSIGYTETILRYGLKENIPTSLITNGTYLARYSKLLDDLRPIKVSVSLDASYPEAHDRQRRKIGAFRSTIDGLREALSYRHLSQSLSITSVLISKRSDQLLGMPALLQELGVKKWVVNPLIKVGNGSGTGGPADSKQAILKEILKLRREADKCSVELIVDDEFNKLQDNIDRSSKTVDFDYNHFLQFQRLSYPDQVYRLLPTGQCSVGFEILEEVSPTSPRWSPNDLDASDFLDGILSKKDQ